METFTDKEFKNLAFKSRKPIILDTEFLDKWNNKECINILYNELCVLTPVEWLVIYNCLDGVKYLVENGADITSAGNFTIHAAMSEGHVNIVKYLLSTNIYPEEDIHECAEYTVYKSQFKELLSNYKQFPRTKACK